eukprot:TRINITY_DN2731_c0_g3_i2.p2 TRINITY_DN2731_c0_g3~~TRINITY_DN2731_c0_g3_i2.p2  ORF type:complete len:126 (+),score=47.18 TRINITY_DN2731_c0_g3_i2:137-514(+)
MEYDPRLMSPKNTVKENTRLLEETYSAANDLFTELKRQIEVLKEQIETMKKITVEHNESLPINLTPRIHKAMVSLEEEIRKERKETSKLDYQVNELADDIGAMVQQTQAFFERTNTLYDFIGGCA